MSLDMSSFGSAIASARKNKGWSQKELAARIVKEEDQAAITPQLCVPKTLSVLMEQWNHLSWRNDRAAPFRFGHPGLAIQVEVAA
jgi:hypothetical protein